MNTGSLATLKQDLPEQNWYTLYCFNNVLKDMVVIMGVYDVYDGQTIVSFISLVTGADHWMQRDEFLECFTIISTKEEKCITLTEQTK